MQEEATRLKLPYVQMSYPPSVSTRAPSVQGCGYGGAAFELRYNVHTVGGWAQPMAGRPRKKPRAGGRPKATAEAEAIPRATPDASVEEWEDVDDDEHAPWDDPDDENMPQTNTAAASANPTFTIAFRERKRAQDRERPVRRDRGPFFTMSEIIRELGPRFFFTRQTLQSEFQ